MFPLKAIMPSLIVHTSVRLGDFIRVHTSFQYTDYTGSSSTKSFDYLVISMSSEKIIVDITPHSMDYGPKGLNAFTVDEWHELFEETRRLSVNGKSLENGL